jgi:cysteine desulfurase/selenocysteine lyase
MTVAEILSNEELRQHEFPVTREGAFLAHAGVAPLPRRVAEAVTRYATACTLGDQEDMMPSGLIQKTRLLAADLIGARPDEISLVGPTSLGLSFVAAGLDFRKTDNVLVYHDDYPSNVYPWMALAARGVQVRFLKVKELGQIRPIDVASHIDENTRLVALASCHFVSGWRPAIADIGRVLRARKIFFCVDGIQTLGAFPTPAENVDFIAADAHKWLLGPLAAGILYVRKEVQEKLKPVVHGWANVSCPDYVAQAHLQFQSGGRRYEAGSANVLGIAGLHASLELLTELGTGAITAELLRKRALLVPALQAKGFNVLCADAPAENASGIVSFWKEGTDLPALWARLNEAKIIVSLRKDRSGRHYLRVSPHFYNTDAELHRMLEQLN